MKSVARSRQLRVVPTTFSVSATRIFTWKPSELLPAWPSRHRGANGSSSYAAHTCSATGISGREHVLGESNRAHDAQRSALEHGGRKAGSRLIQHGLRKAAHQVDGDVVARPYGVQERYRQVAGRRREGRVRSRRYVSPRNTWRLLAFETRVPLSEILGEFEMTSSDVESHQPFKSDVARHRTRGLDPTCQRSTTCPQCQRSMTFLDVADRRHARADPQGHRCSRPAATA